MLRGENFLSLIFSFNIWFILKSLILYYMWNIILRGGFLFLSAYFIEIFLLLIN